MSVCTTSISPPSRRRLQTATQRVGNAAVVCRSVSASFDSALREMGPKHVLVQKRESLPLLRVLSGDVTLCCRESPTTLVPKELSENQSATRLISFANQACWGHRPSTKLKTSSPSTKLHTLIVPWPSCRSRGFRASLLLSWLSPASNINAATLSPFPLTCHEIMRPKWFFGTPNSKGRASHSLVSQTQRWPRLWPDHTNNPGAVRRW
mmetsp:Transcript_32716/g.58596  ORF Transcript_32716/g.58596 Transcript_32716/m.58596 type:complete len:208 (+) Transcript_32716:4616-5239(+)